MTTLDQRQEIILIDEEVKRSYLDYAMSVIIGRALPDIRDGLKPVHRRILYAMYELKNNFNNYYKKSARIVGDVIGKYHPHGDSAVYDALVRMAQDFSLRYLLIDGQGNFGSIDGDAPAAMRYTEVRLTLLAHEFLKDIDKETIDFIDNYDGSLKEPTILPTKVPNLLINGASGIAVGMATNIPPHNLGEVARAIIALIDNPSINISSLMQYLPGPDFPTRGIIQGLEGIKDAYTTGRGSIQICARTNIEIHSHTKKTSIVIYELPYQVNKTKLLERIVELVKEKKIEGISDIRDESDRDGIRIVIDIKREIQAQFILKQLFKYTQMQSTFGIILLAIVNNRPELLNLKQILSFFIEHRKNIIFKYTVFSLKKAEARVHELEGLKMALEALDQVIKMVRQAKSPPEAKSALMMELNFSERQSQVILEMRLNRLTSLEREKILDEYYAVTEEISKLRTILSSDALIFDIIRDEIIKLAEVYADSRRTEIIFESDKIDLKVITVEEDIIVTLSHFGYIKCSLSTLYRLQRRGGRGKKGMSTRQEDFVEALFVASSNSYLLVLTNLGRLYWLKVHDLPLVSSSSKGKAIVNLLPLLPQEKVATVLAIRESDFCQDRKLVMVTAQGVLKKTALNNFLRSRGGIIAIKLAKNDHLVGARLTDGNMEIFLATRLGLAIRFKENQVRSMGRSASGVRGITLGKNDSVVSMEALVFISSLLTITANGYGKRTCLNEYPLQNRGGKGVISIKTSSRNGVVVGAIVVEDFNEVMISSNTGDLIRLKVNDIKEISRNTQGVKLKNLVPGEYLVSVGRLVEKN